jgi:hypothetical protein
MRYVIVSNVRGRAGAPDSKKWPQRQAVLLQVDFDFNQIRPLADLMQAQDFLVGSHQK